MHNESMTIERTWIEKLQQRWPRVDLRHDTFYSPQFRQILTSDMLVEGVHFSWRYFTPQQLGWKSIAVNLSDIAATGGLPQWVLINLGIPDDCGITLMEQLYEGIEACCNQFRCQVVGGDTVRAGETVVSVTASGILQPNYTPGRRDQAQPGDVIAVSGLHGLSRAGLEALQRNLPGYSEVKHAHTRPMPRVKLGQQIARVVPRFAMMDSSDGLADAVIRLAEASKMDLIIDESRLAIHSDVESLARMANANPLDWVLHGGEDFQLVVCLPPETVALFPDLHPVGMVQSPRLTGQGRAFMLAESGERIHLSDDKAFQHFTGDADAHQAIEASFSI